MLQAVTSRVWGASADLVTHVGTSIPDAGFQFAGDDLRAVNQYAFAGNCTYRDGFSALILSAGHGNSTLYLADQLRHTDAQLVHLDSQDVHLNLARQRGQRYGLRNIRWSEGGIHRDGGKLTIAGIPTDMQFDYVDVSGVSSSDLPAALDRLLSQMNDRAVLRLAVPAGCITYDQLRAAGISANAAQRRRLVDLRRRYSTQPEASHRYAGLQAQAKIALRSLQAGGVPKGSMSLAQLDVILNQAGLQLQAIAPATRALYELDVVDSDISAWLASLSLAQRGSVAQWCRGGIVQHEVWATRSHEPHSESFANLVPLFDLMAESADLRREMLSAPDGLFTRRLCRGGEKGLSLELDLNNSLRRLVAAIDGRRTLEQIVSSLDTQGQNDLDPTSLSAPSLAAQVHQAHAALAPLRKFDLVVYQAPGVQQLPMPLCLR